MIMGFNNETVQVGNIEAGECFGYMSKYYMVVKKSVNVDCPDYVDLETGMISSDIGFTQQVHPINLKAVRI